MTRRAIDEIFEEEELQPRKREPPLVTGQRLTRRDLELLDALLTFNGNLTRMGRHVGLPLPSLRSMLYALSAKIGLEHPSRYQLAIWRAKMIGAMEHYQGVRRWDGYLLRDLYHPDARNVGPEHPFFDILHPLRVSTPPPPHLRHLPHDPAAADPPAADDA